MIQIAFQPALDPYHTIFRLLRLMPSAKLAGRLECDHIRILDFYLAFPFRLDGIKVKSDHRRFKRVGKIYEKTKPYGDMPEDKIAFERMRPIQTTAFQHLSVCDIIDGRHLDEGWIVPTGVEIPKILADRVADANRNDSELMTFLGLMALEYSLSGTGGLKERTRLMEHRYDAA
ncbi:ABC-three component system middle component 5 [Methylobacterium indicum]|uniref:ABC-three component system middle component 5 n=1 Tax=Methylobacterium indicum TaxID=1775910 RepID=UPI00104204A9|nr:ABC-three component system middle component 5 [Methylobacterium indicum]